MSHALDYAPPIHPRPSRVLAWFAHATLVFPVLVLASLCVEWLLAWYMLGHRPRVSWDDPKYIIGSSWMHWVVLIGIVSFLPVAFGALVINILYVINQRLRGLRRIGWLGCVVTMWIATIAAFKWDPFEIMEWWVD